MSDNKEAGQDGQAAADPGGKVMQNGVPVHASDEEAHEEAMGLPHSDRQFSETAAASHGGNQGAAKHDHTGSAGGNEE